MERSPRRRQVVAAGSLVEKVLRSWAHVAVRRLNEAGGDTGQDPRLNAGRNEPAIDQIRHRIHGILIEELGPILYDTPYERRRASQAGARVSSTRRWPRSGRRCRPPTRPSSSRTSPTTSSATARSTSSCETRTCQRNHVQRSEADLRRARRQARTDDVTFVDETHLRRIIDKIVAQVGRRIDESIADV